MTKLMAVVDWDGTCRNGFTIGAWVRYLAEASLVSTRCIEELELTFSLHRDRMISHDDLAARTANVYAKFLSRIPQAQLEEHVSPFLLIDRPELFEFSLRLLSHLQSRGVSVNVISGAPIEILSHYRVLLGLEDVFGLQLRIANGRYTGEVLLNPGMSVVKDMIVRRITHSGQSRILVAVGNSSSDVPLFQAAPISIVINNRQFQPRRRGVFHLSPQTNISALLGKLDRELARS